MNITRVGNSNLVIDCKTCGQEAATPYASITIIDEFRMAVPCSTPGCTRVTFSSRQRDDDDPALWDWDHNRAMNFAFSKALASGATMRADLPALVRTRLLAEKVGAPKKRFDAEKWKNFAATDRVKSVAEEGRERAQGPEGGIRVG